MHRCTLKEIADFFGCAIAIDMFHTVWAYDDENKRQIQIPIEFIADLDKYYPCEIIEPKGGRYEQ